MIAQACKRCKVHHIRSARPLVAVEQQGAAWIQGHATPSRTICTHRKASCWLGQHQVSRCQSDRRQSHAVPVNVPVALSLVVRPMFISLLCSVVFPAGVFLVRRLVLADAGDWVSQLPLMAKALRPSRNPLRGNCPSRWGIFLALLACRGISQWGGTSTWSQRQPGWRKWRQSGGSGRQGQRGTTRKRPAPRGVYRPKGGLSPLQRGPLVRRCGRAAPRTPTSIMARVWVPWERRGGVLSLAGPRVAHMAGPCACLLAESALR